MRITEISYAIEDLENIRKQLCKMRFVSRYYEIEQEINKKIEEHKGEIEYWVRKREEANCEQNTV